MAENNRIIDVLPSGDGFDPDLEESFNAFREDVVQNQAEITLRVFKLPMDERGNLRSAGSHINLFSTPIDVYSLDEIIEKVRNEFMEPNERQIYVRLFASRKGKRGAEMNRVVCIAKPFKPKPENASAGFQGRESIAEIMQAIERLQAAQQVRTEQFIASMLQRQAVAPPVADPVEMATKLMSAMSGMMGVIAPARAAPAGNSLLEQVQVLQSLKALTEGGGNDDEKDTRESNTQDVLIHGLRALPAVLGAISQSRPPAHPGVSPRPGNMQVRPRVLGPGISPPEGAPQPNPQPQLTAGEREVLAQIKPHLETLINFAEQNGDPAMVAEMIVEQLPENLDEKFLTFIENPKAIDRLSLFDRRIMQNREWFERLIAAILKQFEPVESAAAPASDTPSTT